MLKVLILGASSDIGKELIHLLKSHEKKIMIHAHFNSTKKYLRESACLKVIKSNFLVETEDKILKKFDNDYDVLINLVGYIPKSNFHQDKLINILNVIKVNSIIPFQIFKKSLAKLIKKKSGIIINTSSIGVKFGGGSTTFSYSLSKHINEFIPKDFRNLIKYGITYNVVRIGVVNTKIHKKISNKDLKKRIKLIPLGKMLSKKDVSQFIYFLIFQNKTISNQVLSITGGE